MEACCEYSVHENPVCLLVSWSIDSLQTKYSDQIFIDTDIFDNVKLTRIDMFVIEQNVPYPAAVPSFPILTTDNKLDYGQVMPKDDEIK